MKKKKEEIRVYVLMLSKEFPKEHPKAGEPTGFADQLKVALSGCKSCNASKLNCLICVTIKVIRQSARYILSVKITNVGRNG